MRRKVLKCCGWLMRWCHSIDGFSSIECMNVFKRRHQNSLHRFNAVERDMGRHDDVFMPKQHQVVNYRTKLFHVELIRENLVLFGNQPLSLKDVKAGA